MSSTSANNSMSIFKDGKLEPGIYKIQNIVSHTYVDMREDTRQLCCRPATVLEGKGLVGLCLHSVRIIMILITFSGKFSHPATDIPSVGYSTETRFSLPYAERGNVGRTWEARALLYYTRGVKRRK